MIQFIALLLICGLLIYIIIRLFRLLFKMLKNRAPEPQEDVPYNHDWPSYMKVSRVSYMEPPIRYAQNISHQKHFVVFDFETTGIDVDYCEIIEIGALKYSEGEIIDTFETFVKPHFPIPSDATEVNHITNEMVEYAPSAEDIIPKFLDFIGDSKLIGYNIAKYDYIILRRYALGVCGVKLDNMITDVYKMARRKLALPKYRLSDVANHFMIDISNAHRALGDCETTLECFLKLQEIYRADLEYRRTHKDED